MLAVGPLGHGRRARTPDSGAGVREQRDGQRHRGRDPLHEQDLEASTSDSTRHSVNLEAGRLCGRAELIVVSRERKSIEVVTDQQCASQVNGVQ